MPAKGTPPNPESGSQLQYTELLGLMVGKIEAGRLNTSSRDGSQPIVFKLNKIRGNKKKESDETAKRGLKYATQ